MKSLSLSAIVMSVMLIASSAFAGTSANISVGRGESSTTSYNLTVSQTYEPWVSSQTFEITPFTELGGHLWVPDNSDYDNVWGVSLAPGLRFDMLTDAMFNPFIAISVGGAANTKTHIKSRDLGTNVLFKTKGVVGVEFGEDYHHHIQGEYIKYSNWGIAKNNDGFSTVGASYGYSF